MLCVIVYLQEYRTVALQFISRRAALDRKIHFDGKELTKRETAFLPQHPPRLFADKHSKPVVHVCASWRSEHPGYLLRYGIGKDARNDARPTTIAFETNVSTSKPARRQYKTTEKKKN